MRTSSKYCRTGRAGSHGRQLRQAVLPFAVSIAKMQLNLKLYPSQTARIAHRRSVQRSGCNSNALEVPTPCPRSASFPTDRDDALILFTRCVRDAYGTSTTRTLPSVWPVDYHPTSYEDALDECDIVVHRMEGMLNNTVKATPIPNDGASWKSPVGLPNR